MDTHCRISDLLLLARSNSSDVIAVKLTGDCRQIVSVVTSTPTSEAVSWAAIVADDATSHNAAYAASVPTVHATTNIFRILISSDGKATAGPLKTPLPNMGAGCEWRALALISDSHLFAGAACESTAPVSRGGAPNNTLVMSATTGEPLASVAAYLDDGSSAWIGGGWANWMGGDERYGLLVAGGGGVSRALPVMMTSAVGRNSEVTLRVGQAFDMDAGREWSSFAHGSGWLASERAQSVSLLALRRYDKSISGDEFVVQTLVHAPAHVIGARMMSVSGALGQQDLTGSFLNVTYEGAAFNTSKLKRLYAQTHTNTHNVLVCHGYQYTAILELLRATTDFHVDGRQLRIWAEILPPTEAVSDDCEVPPDSPTTPFNETEVFATIGNASLGYLNYEAWGEVLGRVAAQWPHLVSFQMDDFTHDVYSPPYAIFTPPLLARLTSRMRTHAPHMTFLPVVYYSEGSQSVLDRWPDLIDALDAPLYYFRNQRRAQGHVPTRHAPSIGALRPFRRPTQAARVVASLVRAQSRLQ